MIVFSGSFDPFHKGHDFMLNHLLENFNEDIVIVVQQNVWKGQGRFSLEERKAMLQYYLKDKPRVRVESCPHLYFYEMSQDYLGAKFVVGADSWRDLAKWKNYEKIKDLEFLVFARDGVEAPYPQGPSVSSTFLRKCDDNMKYSIPLKIWHYLCFHNLVKDYWRPAVSTDILLIHNNKFLALKRKEEPFANKWVLPGGHLDETDFDLKDCALRELKEETSLCLEKEDLNDLAVLSNKDRDPRKRMITVAYYHELDSLDEVVLSDENEEFSWLNLDENHDMGFDHLELLEKYQLIRKT